MFYFVKEISLMESCDWSISQCLQTSNEASAMLLAYGFRKFISQCERAHFQTKNFESFISKQNFEINFQRERGLFWKSEWRLIVDIGGCSGTYDIVVGGKKVGEYVEQGSFGELALMYNVPRAATILATSEGKLWAMVRHRLLPSLLFDFSWFLARDVIYTSRAYATMSVSVCLSVCPSVCDGSALAHYS